MREFRCSRGRPHRSAALVREAALEEGLSDSKGASALGTNYRVGQRELGELLERAGLSDVRVDTFVDTLEGSMISSRGAEQLLWQLPVRSRAGRA